LLAVEAQLPARVTSGSQAMHDALWWEYKIISIAICFVIAVGCHVLYTILTNGRSLEDDARWYAQQRKEETARKKAERQR
jgi:hypothetical protein